MEIVNFLVGKRSTVALVLFVCLNTAGRQWILGTPPGILPHVTILESV